jgi:serine/threonine protein kinase, bacterial
MFGRYRLLTLLGRGGMGEVWRAHDSETGRIVAVKMLLAQFTADEEFPRRFRHEARTAASLSNPHVVPIHDFGEIDGRLFVDMRLIDGRDLASMLRDQPLTPSRSVAIIEQVASALTAAHRVGLVHRDVKPSNILVAEHDFVYLIDFGLARAADGTRLTSTGSVIGTWAYMAPERFGVSELDSRSDVYSLACVFYECLTGVRPFPGDSMHSQFAGHLRAEPPRPSVARRGIPPGIDAVIARGMAKDPAHRFQSAAEFADAANTALARSGSSPVSRPWTRKRLLVGVIVAGVVAFSVIGVTGLWPGEQNAAVASGDQRAAGISGESADAPPPAAPVDPVPVSYGPQQVLPFSGLDGPQGIAIDDSGAVYVSDMRNARVLKLSGDTQTELPFVGLAQPTDIDVDAAGNVYAIDFDDGTAHKLSAGTNVQSEVPLEGFIHPGDITADDSGNVYVAGYNNGSFIVAKIMGGVGPQIPVPFNASVSYFAVSDSGAVYSASSSSNHLFMINPEYTTEQLLTITDLDPSSIAVGADGAVYVADVTNGGAARLAPGADAAVALPFADLRRPVDIAVDVHGNVYVTDVEANVVLKLPVVPGAGG